MAPIHALPAAIFRNRPGIDGDFPGLMDGVMIARAAVPNPSAQDAFFDELAEFFAQRYESHPAFRSRRELFTSEARAVLDRQAGSDSAPECLDLGCGPGIIAGAIADLGFRVTGVDRSEKMIGAAQRMAAKRTNGASRLAFVQCDVGDFVSACSQKFSLVISSSVLEYLEDPLRVIKIASWRLHPGGTLAFSVPNFDSVFRVVEPWIQSFLPARARYRAFWGNQLSASDYLKAAFDLGLSLEKVRTFGLPKVPLAVAERVLTNRHFHTMTFLVFRRI
jgi:2-polyprenyl-3-methyl-5-hydroxy-6-metoxy-1,4-benzoquinol methylase